MAPAEKPSEGSLPPSSSLSSDQAASADTPSGGSLATGQLWHGKYRIGEAMPGPGPSIRFRAVTTYTAEDVTICAFPTTADTAARAQVWEKLAAVHHPALAEPVEAFVEDGQRIEIVRAPSHTTLRQWRAGLTMDVEELKELVRQMADALGALHQAGLAHLNLRPETVYVLTAEGSLRFVLAGLEETLLSDRQNAGATTVDPFYAPPEAVSQPQTIAGTELSSWDWWTLGRVVQERILCGHVFDLILGCDSSYKSHELKPAAAEILLETDSTAPRAGAVELMPPMEQMLVSLLRGLLTTARHARWGAAEVQRWLKGEAVSEHYALAKAERLFPWKGQSYFVAEVAARFQQAAHWADGLINLFDEKNPAYLVAFVGAAHEHQEQAERLKALAEFGEKHLRELAPEVRRDAVAALSLLFLVGKGALILRGRPLDANGLTALLADGPTGLALFRAVTSPEYIREVDPSSRDAGNTLLAISRLSGEALALVNRHSWIAADDEAGQRELLTRVLEPRETLVNRIASLRQTYAANRDAALERIFKSGLPSHAELAVLVYTARDPVRFGFLTHVEWNAEQCRRLRERGQQVASALYWTQLAGALHAGPMVFGPGPILAVVWGLLAAGTLVCRHDLVGLAFALAPGVVVWALRLAAIAWQRTQAQRRGAQEGPWVLRDAAARCQREAARTLKAEKLSEPRALAPRLAEINTEIAAKTPANAASAPLAAPSVAIGWIVVIASWLSLAAAVAGLTISLRHFQMPAGLASSAPAPVDQPAQTQPGVKIPWNHPTPAELFEGIVDRTLKATDEQLELARTHAESWLDIYLPETVTGCVGVRVPTDTGFGIMIYDGRRRRLADNQVYMFTYPPEKMAWFRVGGRNVLFIGGSN